jgi:LEA14-like dessication related protein
MQRLTQEPRPSAQPKDSPGQGPRPVSNVKGDLFAKVTTRSRAAARSLDADARRDCVIPKWMSLALLLLLASAGCAGLQKSIARPTAHVDTVSLKEVDLQAATVEFGVSVGNPYSVSLPVSGLDFALSSEGERFLEGQAAIDQVIPANGTGLVKVPVRVPFAEMYAAISGLQLGTSVPYVADLGLNVQTPILGIVRLPLRAEGEIRLPGIR